MKVSELKSTMMVPALPDQCWNFFSDPENLGKITPPGMDFRILGSALTASGITSTSSVKRKAVWK